MAAEAPVRTVDKLAVLFVCMGNICRSPTAEAVFRAKLQEAGLAGEVEVDSAGTHAQVGDPPDRRAIRAAAELGYDMRGLRARQLSAYDAERFDYILVMDRSNYRRVVRELGSAQPGPHQRARVEYLMRFARSSEGAGEVPDPYAGGDGGFRTVLSMIEDACDGLLDEVRARLKERKAPPVTNGT